MKSRLRRGVVLALCALMLALAFFERVPSGVQAVYTGPEDNIRRYGNCNPRRLRVKVSEALDVLLDVREWPDRRALEIVFASHTDIVLTPELRFVEIRDLDNGEVWTQQYGTIWVKRYLNPRMLIWLGPTGEPVGERGYQIRLPEFSYKSQVEREDSPIRSWSPDAIFVRLEPSFFQWRPKICDFP